MAEMITAIVQDTVNNDCYQLMVAGETGRAHLDRVSARPNRLVTAVVVFDEDRLPDGTVHEAMFEQIVHDTLLLS